MAKLYIYTDTPVEDDKTKIIPNKIYEYDMDTSTINVNGEELFVVLKGSYWTDFKDWKVLEEGDVVHTVYYGEVEANFKFSPLSSKPFVMTEWLIAEHRKKVNWDYECVNSTCSECFFGPGPVTKPEPETEPEPEVETEENPFFNVMGEDKGITIVQQTIIINVIQENGD